VTAKALPALLSVIAVITGGAIAIASASFGPLSIHMATHIAVMNVAAPLLAVILIWPSAGRSPLHRFAVEHFPRYWLWVGALTQLVLLLIWHLPPLHSAQALPPALAAMTSCLLLLSSLLFWLALTAHAEDAPWQAMLALMLTGKVACLMGGVLVFAPRALYASHHGVDGSLADQQLAGLLMLAICPLSYVVAGIAIAAQMVVRIERDASSAVMREPAAR
jgi:putative membrane protein